MKSWWIRTRNGTIDLEARDVAVPQAGPGEILLRVHSTALNRAEFNPRYQAEGVKPGGIEAAGEVQAVGDGVNGVKPGDRIMGRARGGFAGYALLNAYDAIPVPECLTWEQAAAVPLAFLVTYDMLYPYGRLKSGEWLLVTGTSSGVGVACLQTGKLLGAKVIGTSGSADKLAKLQALGLDAGIHTRGPDFAARTKTLTGGKGVDLIVNNVGGSVFPECLRALAFQGRLATVGSVDGVMKCELDLDALHTNRLELFGVSNRFTTPVQRARTVSGFIRDLLPAFADGRIAPVVDRIFTFDELPAARDYMESNAQVGRIVVRVS
jgi:NADPH:quinone reductase-like Zn-dependent oxidoreductase